MKGTASCLAKLKRMDSALHHEEPDRVAISVFFWGNFIKHWRKELKGTIILTGKIKNEKNFSNESINFYLKKK